MKQNSDSYARNSNHTDISILRRLAKNIQNPRDKIIFQLILETGCSAEELICLKPGQFEFTTCSLTIGHKKERRVRVPLELSLQLNSFLKPGEEHIFSTRQGSCITKRRVQQLVKSTSLSLLGKELTVRDIRRMSAALRFTREKSETKTAIESGKKEVKSKEYLSEAQLIAIRQGITIEQHRLMFDIISETGCLLQELVNIKAKDAQIHSNEIIIRAENTKDNKQRVSKISSSLSLRIRLFISKNNITADSFLFSTRQSAMISDKRVFQIMKGYGKQAGFSKVSPQILRNSHIIQALNDNRPEYDIIKQTGVKHLDPSHYGLGKLKKVEKRIYENT